VGKKAKKNLPAFTWYEESGSHDECIALKHYISKSWLAADDLERDQLARWIVLDWGGVRANSIATLQDHLALALNEESRKPLKGVASYSKILTAKDCKRYAIYDARVAACLNAAQLLMKVERPIFFQYVPSRNKTIKSFMSAFPKQALVDRLGWTEIEKDETYSTYISLLHSLRMHFTDKEVYHFEMALFSLAPVLCAELVQNSDRSLR
jgi:hypothetical protein